MKWLKHNGKLINLTHITAIEVEGKEVEFRGEKHESLFFNSEEAAQGYFEHVAQVLGVSDAN